MPLAFSFFNTSFLKPRADEEAAPADPGRLEEVQPKADPEAPGVPFSPFPVTSAFAGSPLNWSDDRFPILPAETVLIQDQKEDGPPPLVRLPERRAAKADGIAAIAVSQSAQEAPPLNSRQSILGTSEPPPLPASALVPDPAPPVDAGIHALRGEVMNEIEQVKNDLFGAVMGVSALKDRLDGLEQQVTALPTAPTPPIVEPPSRADVEQWSADWLSRQLQPALEGALVPLLEKIATKSRLRLPFTPADAATALSQPPVILTCTPV